MKTKKLECSDSSALFNSVKEELCAAVTQSGKCSDKLVGVLQGLDRREEIRQWSLGSRGPPDEV